MKYIFKNQCNFQSVLIISLSLFSCSPSKYKSELSNAQSASTTQPISQLPTRVIAVPSIVPAVPAKAPTAPNAVTPVAPVIVPTSSVATPVVTQPSNTLLAPNISLNL